MTAYINLGVTYDQLGDFEKALTNSQDAIRLEPDESRGYHNAALSYMGLNRPEEARAVVLAASQRNPSFHSMHDDLANIAYAQGDIAGMEKEEGFLHDEPDLEMNVDFRHGGIAAYHGQLQKAKEFYEKGRQVAQRLQLKDGESYFLATQAYGLAMFGNSKPAIDACNAGLALGPSFNNKGYIAQVLAFAGENKKSVDLAGQVARERSDDTLVRAVFVPSMEATVALNAGDARKAIETLKPALAYDKATQATLYVRGMAYLKAGQATEAAGEFQKILALSNFDPANLLIPFARLGLARVYAVQGDTAKAKSTYQDVLAFWKDADQDLPVVKQAQAEYAKLQ